LLVGFILTCSSLTFFNFQTIPGGSGGGTSFKEQRDQFLERLPTLVNRDLIDQAAVDFVSNLNNKATRNKLLFRVHEVPRSRLDLLPFYARLVAALQPVR